MYKTEILNNGLPLLAVDSLAEWLRIDLATEQYLVESLIATATARVEVLANQDIVGKEYKLYTDSLATIALPHNRVSSIIEVKYYNENNVLTTYTLGNAYLAGHNVFFKTDGISLYDRPDAVQIRYTTAPTAQHLSIATTCIKLLVGQWYDNRADTKYAVPSMVEAMLTNIRIIEV